MTRQDKATTELHAHQLRELVKLPENKLCADCKRNDARWASWNIGAFICIRCSGVHRGMGTHISKVKSIDLDTWTPEQMKSIQKWGNHRANLYWEAHLRPGHNPPDHKMESFIRSKYESRRWAREGPVPKDPAVLEEGGGDEYANSKITSAVSTSEAANTLPKLSSPLQSTHQPQPRPLQSVANTGHVSPARASLITEKSDVRDRVSQSASSASAQNDLFSLDFHAPVPSQSLTSKPAVQESTKQDIMCLFSTPTSAITGAAPVASINQQQTAAFNRFGGTTSFAQMFQSQAQPQSTSMMGTAGTGLWGVQSGWTAPTNPAILIQPNIWGGSQSEPSSQNPVPLQQGLFETQNIWDSNSTSASGRVSGGNSSLQNARSANSTQTSIKDDIFRDLWS